MKKANKLISILLIMVMMLTIAPISAFAATEAYSSLKSVKPVSYSNNVTNYFQENNYLYKLTYTNMKNVKDVELWSDNYSQLRLSHSDTDSDKSYSDLMYKSGSDRAYLGDLPKTPGGTLSCLSQNDEIYINGNKPVIIITCLAVNAPVWTWNGTSSATAKFTSTDGNAFANVSAAISQQTVTEATTCKIKEQVKYTASVTFNGQSYTNTKTVTGAAGPHSYVDGKCEHCGYECPHNSFTDSKCDVCGIQHTHDYIYTANDNVITATCSNKEGFCPDTDGGRLTISSPAELYTDGTISREAVIDNQLVESTDYTVTYSTADGSAPKTAGTYTASVTIGGATASVEFTLSDYVAKVTDEDGNLISNYKTLADAVTAAEVNEESTLTLLDDITLSSTQYINTGKITLDLNGKNLVSESGRVIELFADVVLTIKDSGEGGTIEAKRDVAKAIINKGTLTVESGTVKGDGGIDNYGTLTFNNGTVEAGEYGAISNFNMAYVYDGVLRSSGSAAFNNYSTAYVYGGEISGVLNEGTAYISGGKIFRNNYAAFNLHAGTVEITGGSFSGTDWDSGYVSGTPYGEWTVCYTEGVNLILKGGEFPNGFVVDKITANEFLADGYHFRNEQGKVVDGSSRIIKEKVTVEKGADFSADAVVNVDNVVYNGAAQEPTVTVKVGGKTLTEGKDYTLVFANNVNAGTATVTVTSAGDYEGEIVKTFEIKKADSSIDVYPEANELTYNGEAQTLVTAGSSESGTVVYSLDGAEYYVSVPTGTNAGEYTVYYKVEGDSNHNDSEPATVTVTIGKKAVTVSATVPDRIYGDDYRVDTSKVVVIFDGVVDGDNVGYVVIDAYYHMHTVTDSAPVQVVYNVNGTDAGNYQFPEYGDWLAPNYPVQATGKVLPRDIADAEITLGDTLTYNSTEQTQSIASVTIIGKDVTYTVSGNTATNVGIYELTITGNGNFTGTKTVTFEIAPDTSAIDNLTDDNVKSSDKTSIEAVTKQIENAITDLADDAKKAEYKEIADKCDELLAKIDTTADEIARIDEAVNGYDKETVTSDDVPALGELIDEIEVLTDGNNLTEEQKTELEELKAELEALLEEIEKAGTAVDAIGAELEMLDEKRATIFHEDEIEALKAKIDELLTNENMGKEEKAKLDEYKAQCDNLIEIINTPVKYFSMRLLYLIYDAFNWLVSHIMLIFSMNF